METFGQIASPFSIPDPLPFFTAEGCIRHHFHNDPRKEACPELNLKDRTEEYRNRDLHGENEWPLGTKRRYGGVIYNLQGFILLREPLNHFDGYHWTFPKGHPDPSETPFDTALRETAEETGLRPLIIGQIPGIFTGSPTGASNYYYLMFDDSDSDLTAMHDETIALRWASNDEAVELISRSTNATGRARDLRILKAAFVAFELLQHPTPPLLP